MTRGYKLCDNATLVEKMVEIGDWNMDANGTVAVAHGLTWTDIRGVSAMIRSDAGTSLFQLQGYDVSTPAGDGYISAIDASDVNLARTNGGAFDNINFNATSYNRGWVLITYEA